MSSKVITQPSVEIVTLEEAKIHLRIDYSDEDSLVSSLIVAARKQAEHMTGRAFGVQTRELIIDAFPDDEIRLPGTPVTSIVSVTYADSSGNTVVMPEDGYALDSDYIPSSLFPSSEDPWPDTYDTANAVRIRYVCGHEAGTAESVRVWMLMTVGTMYRHRESIANAQSYALPRSAYDVLLDPFDIRRAT